jgi:hypothetical protein
MYFDDHQPPHFHGIYGTHEAQIGINPIRVLRGSLPRRVESMVIEWTALHQQELMQNWHRLENDQPAEAIEPLE